MHKRLILIGAACLVTSGAVAADLTIIEPAPIYVEPELFDWSGFYVGVNGGYGGGVFKHPFQLNGPEFGGGEVELVEPGPGQIVYATGSADVTAGGFVGGVQGGFNWQFDDNFLIGIEGDIQGSTIDGRVSLSITDETGSFDYATLNADLGTRLDWFATLRPRIGWVSDRFVVYATGGLAWGQTTSSVNLSVDELLMEPFEESVTNDRFGWTVGAGIEYALTDTITFKTEYLYTDLGSEQMFALDVPVTEEVPLTFSADSTVAFHMVRAGLNFQF